MGGLSPLASASATRRVLEEHGLAAKHSLGQNFLVDNGVLEKTLALAAVGPEDVVLEVGPGIGTLSIVLLEHAGRVVAVERDRDLLAVLAQTLEPWRDRFTLINKDALHLRQEDVEIEGAAAPSKLVANLPYAVAATLVLRCFERLPSLKSATVMVQKEVADRMAARPGTKNYGAYTVKLRLFAEVAGRFGVGPKSFYPPPRVDSAVLRLDRRPCFDGAGAELDAEALAACFTMAEAAFAARRKTLQNSCKAYFAAQGPKGAAASERLPQLFAGAGIDPRRRGETLDLADFVSLARAYQQL